MNFEPIPMSPFEYLNSKLLKVGDYDPDYDSIINPPRSAQWEGIYKPTHSERWNTQYDESIDQNVIKDNMEIWDDKGILDDKMAYYENLIVFLAVGDVELQSRYANRIKSWIVACIERTNEYFSDKDVRFSANVMENYSRRKKSIEEMVKGYQEYSELISDFVAGKAADFDSLEQLAKKLKNEKKIKETEVEKSDEGMGPNE